MASNGKSIIGSGATALSMLLGPNSRPPGMEPNNDPITDPAALTGPRGRAWRVDVDELRRFLGVLPEDDGVIASWVVEAPSAHPLWHSYAIDLLHLRPLQTPRELFLYLPDATHEIWVQALDPEMKNRQAYVRGKERAQVLSPINYASQFIEIEDDLARERVRKAVQEICNGSLSPDTDYRFQWAKKFGDCMFVGRPVYRPPQKVTR